MSINSCFVIVTMEVIEPPRSFPRDSSASLGMTAGIFHGKKRTQNDRSAGDRWSPLQKTITKAYFFHSHPLFFVMLSKRSASKHLAEANRKKRFSNNVSP